jgi:large subunit ribosomal protein L6
MSTINSKYNIKIPKNIIVLYCDTKNIITIVGPLGKKALKLKVKLEILKLERTIYVTSIPNYQMSNSSKKKHKAMQGTTVALIKQLFIETLTIFYQKLKFVGVGYRAFEVDQFKDELLLFKLGYSHHIYFKIPKNIDIFCLKLTKLFIYGNSYQNITQVAATIQSHKFPEPYKGKGILHENEKIKLKEGKKV